MATGSQIHKVQADLANLNTNYYQDFSLTLALHPSETKDRLMFRLLAFLYSAHESLEFSDGLDSPEQPDIWQKNLRGEIEHWIDLGQPDEKRIRKASGLSEKVSIFTYSSGKATTWFEKIQPKLKQNKKIKVYHLNEAESGALEKLVERTMKLSCMIEDEQIYLSNDDLRVQISLESWLG